MIKVYRDAKGEYRWRLQASNNKVIAESGEGYKEIRKCLYAIDVVKCLIGCCDVKVDVTFAAKKPTKKKAKKKR